MIPTTKTTTPWKFIAIAMFGALALWVLTRQPFSIAATLPFLIALACPVGMGLMMVVMGRSMMGDGTPPSQQEAHPLSTLSPQTLQSLIATTQHQQESLQQELAARER